MQIPWGRRFYEGVLLALACILLALGVSALRWRVILGTGAPGWPYLWKLYLVGSFFSLFLPTSVGGDAVRAAAASQALGRPGGAVTSVIVDRLFGTLALGIYFLIGIALVPTILGPAMSSLHWKMSARTMLLGAVGSLTLAILFAWLLFRRRAVPASLREGGAMIARLWREPRVTVEAMVLGLVVQAAYIAAWTALGSALSLPLSWLVFVACVPLVSLAAMLPVTISGLGLREGLWVVLLSPFAVPSATAVVFSLSYFFCLICVGAIGGLLFIVRGTTWHGHPMPATDLATDSRA